MSDEMDVDPTRLGGISASSSGTSQLHIEGVDLDTLNINMKRKSDSILKGWLCDIDEGEAEWPQLILLVLLALTKELAATELSSKVITSLNIGDAAAMIKGLSDPELEQLKE